MVDRPNRSLPRHQLWTSARCKKFPCISRGAWSVFGVSLCSKFSSPLLPLLPSSPATPSPSSRRTTVAPSSSQPPAPPHSMPAVKVLMKQASEKTKGLTGEEALVVLEEALVVLEAETKTLQMMHKEDLLSPMIMSYMSAISDRRDRLVDWFACFAEHPRVSQPEMQKALCGLCRLGENQRANILLLKYFHSHLANYVQELERSKPDLHGMYLRGTCKHCIFRHISSSKKLRYVAW